MKELCQIIADEIAVEGTISKVQVYLDAFNEKDSEMLMYFFTSAADPSLYSINRTNMLAIKEALIKRWEGEFVNRRVMHTTEDLAKIVESKSKLDILFGSLGDLANQIDGTNPWRTMGFVAKYIEYKLEERKK